MNTWELRQVEHLKSQAIETMASLKPEGNIYLMDCDLASIMTIASVKKFLSSLNKAYDIITPNLPKDIVNKVNQHRKSLNRDLGKISSASPSDISNPRAACLDSFHIMITHCLVGVSLIDMCTLKHAKSDVVLR